METGQTIAGKYRLNRLLGTGGMASVWSATNVFTEREFAIKFMLPQVARTPEAARRFLLEAKVSARINHPNIIEVIDVGQAEDSSLFLVMELLTGVVARRRHRGASTPSMPVARLHAVHARRGRGAGRGAPQRRHPPRSRSRRTSSCTRTATGASCRRSSTSGSARSSRRRTTRRSRWSGTVLGSPLYMSPEQAMGARGHRRAHRRLRLRRDPVRGALRAARVRRAELQRAHRDHRDDAAQEHRRRARRTCPSRCARSSASAW